MLTINEPRTRHLINLIYKIPRFIHFIEAKKEEEYRDALKGGPQVVRNWLGKLCFVYRLQAAERNFLNSFSHNLRAIF